MSYAIAAAALLLSCTAAVSCSDEPGGSGNDVEVTFRLSLDSLRATRAANSGWDDYSPTTPGTAAENAVNPEDLAIKVCDAAGGIIADVADVRLRRLSESEYAVTGTWRDSGEQIGRAKKVMVIANSGHSASADGIATLSFARDSIGGYIPLWGVAKLPPLSPGTRNDIGTVSLLRAVAKVEVDLRGDMEQRGYSIASATVNNVNTRGYCLPMGYASVMSTSQLDFASTPHFLPSTASQAAIGGDGTAYLAEYDNTSATAVPSTITVVLNRNGAYEGTYTLRFCGYDSDGAPTGAPFDIVRNHLYYYTLYKSSDQMEITLSVRPWNVRQHDDIIM